MAEEPDMTDTTEGLEWLERHHRSGVPVLREVFADPGNHGWYYRERKPDSVCRYIHEHDVRALLARAEKAEAEAKASHEQMKARRDQVYEMRAERDEEKRLAEQWMLGARAMEQNLSIATEALHLIATHRSKCHDYDDDTGGERREFDAEDVKIMEYAALIALAPDMARALVEADAALSALEPDHVADRWESIVDEMLPPNSTPAPTVAEAQAAYGICIDLYGECRCLLAERPPCEAMIDMVSDGATADDERERIADAIAEAQED